VSETPLLDIAQEARRIAQELPKHRTNWRYFIGGTAAFVALVTWAEGFHWAVFIAPACFLIITEGENAAAKERELRKLLLLIRHRTGAW